MFCMTAAHNLAGVMSIGATFGLFSGICEHRCTFSVNLTADYLCRHRIGGTHDGVFGKRQVRNRDQDGCRVHSRRWMAYTKLPTVTEQAHSQALAVYAVPR